MELNIPSLILALIFSSIGLGYFLYGKRQQQFVFLLAGLALMIYPYIVSGAFVMTVVGLVLLAVPFAARQMGW
jgi:hypothetical protein